MTAGGRRPAAAAGPVDPGRAGPFARTSDAHRPDRRGRARGQQAPGMLVQLRGYRTDSAFTGGEALEIDRRQRPRHRLPRPDAPRHQRLRGLQGPQDVQGDEPDPRGHGHRPGRRREPHRELRRSGPTTTSPSPTPPTRSSRPSSNPSRWLDQARSGHIQGIISFDSRDDGEILRRLGQLRSLIFARTGLGLDSVAQINRAIKEIWCLADEWHRGHPADRASTLIYTLTAERLTLTFRDAAGWLGRVRGLPDDDPASALVTARFDEVVPDEADAA